MYNGEDGLNDLKSRAPKRRGQSSLGAAGTATITFNPPIDMTNQANREPFMQLTPRVATGDNVVICNVVDGSFTTSSAGIYTGVTIKGGRMTATLPVLTPLSGALTLVTQVVAGVNAIVAALTGLKLYDPAAVSGVKIDWQAS